MSYYGYIYLSRNLVNNKLYIGKFKGSIEKKTQYFGSGDLISKALRKYGKTSFKKYILAYAYSKDELSYLEEMFIKDYNAVEDSRFYNVSSNSNNPIMYGEENPFYGKTHSIEQKQKWSESRKDIFHSEEMKAQISQTLKDRWATDHEMKTRTLKARAKAMKDHKEKGIGRFSEESREASRLRSLGRKHSNKAKLIISEKAVERNKNPEFRKKLSESQQNRCNDNYRTKEFKEAAAQRILGWNKSEAKKESNRRNRCGMKVYRDMDTGKAVYLPKDQVPPPNLRPGIKKICKESSEVIDTKSGQVQNGLTLEAWL